MSNSSKIEIEFSDEFKFNLTILSKKYRTIRNDIQPILENLKLGEFIFNYYSLKVRSSRYFSQRNQANY
jgi:hypothetical protein